MLMDILQGLSKADFGRISTDEIVASGLRDWLTEQPALEPALREFVFDQVMLEDDTIQMQVLSALLDGLLYYTKIESSDVANNTATNDTPTETTGGSKEATPNASASPSKPLVDPSLPLFLIEETLEIHTIDWCQKFWAYLLSREDILARNLSGKRAPGTTLIRMANALLKRLSKTRDAFFSGEILIFLSRAFPLSERSGLNQKGEFNVENVTVYEGMQEDDDEDEEMGDSDDDDDDDDDNVKSTKNGKSDKTGTASATPSGTPKSGSDPVSDQESDAQIYRQFWELQRYFSDPTLLLSAEDPKTAMDTLQTCLNVAVKTLRSHDGSSEFKQTGGRWNRSGGGGGAGHQQAPAESADEKVPATLESRDQFSAKWLTNPDLFQLQLSDTRFRKAVWIQILVFSHFLLSLKSDRKESWAADSAATNRSVMYAYTLDEQDAKFFESLVANFDKEAGTGGTRKQPPYRPAQSPDFSVLLSKIIRQVFERDDVWSLWKLHNCPSYELPAFDKQVIADTETKRQQSLNKVRPRCAHAMGTESLSQLWTVPTGLDRLKVGSGADEKGRFAVPSPEFYISKLEELAKVKELDWDFLTDSEKAQNAQELAAADWLGFRSARVSGYWSKLGLVGTGGLSGIFGTVQEKEETVELEDVKAEVEEEASAEAEGAGEAGREDTKTPAAEEDSSSASTSSASSSEEPESSKEEEEDKDDEPESGDKRRMESGDDGEAEGTPSKKQKKADEEEEDDEDEDDEDEDDEDDEGEEDEDDS